MIRRLAIGIALVVTISCSSGGRPPIEPPQPPPEVTFAVVVTDSQTGAAIEGARFDVQFTVTEDDGHTNADGYVAIQAPPHLEFVTEIHADGFVAWSAVVNLTENAQLEVRLDPIHPSHAHPLVGRLRIEGGAYQDDTGPVLPLFTHAGDLFGRWVDDRAPVFATLDAVQAAGFHGVRFWSVLGGPYWDGWGQSVEPTQTPNYWSELRDFLIALRDRQLRAVFSMGDIGQLREDRRDYMRHLAALASEVDGTGHVLAFVDCGNEAWQTGLSDPRDLSACVQAYREAGGTALLSLTSPPGEETGELDAYSIDPAQVFDVHGYRDGHWFDKVRHVFSITYEGGPRRRLGIQSEPPAYGHHVSVTANQDELDDEATGLMMGMSLIARQAYVLMSSPGVHLDEPIDHAHGFAQATTVTSWLPRDVMAFRMLHHSGQTWAGLRVLVPDADTTRIDCARADDGRFACVIHGPSGAHRLQVARSFVAQLCDPGTLVCAPVERDAGQALELSYVRGRVFVGQVR